MQTVKGKIPEFEGFPKELPDFLWGLTLNNEKPWFEAHREEYERCLHQPIKALAYQVQDALSRRFPKESMTLHISRIYRDARRLHGQGPFNDHLWFSLGLSGSIYTPLPQFWFGINARNYDCGMGLWMAKGETLERWRASLDSNPAKLSRIVRKINKMDGFEQYGELYKRPKGDPGKLLFNWYNARQLGVEKVVWFDPDPPGAELADRLTEEFSQLMPLYRYWLEIQG